MARNTGWRDYNWAKDRKKHYEREEPKGKPMANELEVLTDTEVDTLAEINERGHATIEKADIDIRDLIHSLREARAERDRAASEMVERIRASLREYPHDGGDIGVMKEVERITSAFKDESLTAIAEMETAFGERDAAIAQVEHGDRLILDLKKELRTLREAAGRLCLQIEAEGGKGYAVHDLARELRTLLDVKGEADG